VIMPKKTCPSQLDVQISSGLVNTITFYTLSSSSVRSSLTMPS
jgi:hypothetical protein